MAKVRAATAGAGARGASGARGGTGRGSGVAPGSSRRAKLPRAGSGGGGGGHEPKDLPSWHDSRFQGRLDELKSLGDEVVALQRKRSDLDDEIKAKTVLGRAIMEDINDKESWSVRDDDWTASYVRPKDRQTIVVERLIQKGVSRTVIEFATKKTPVTPFTTFQRRGEPKKPAHGAEEEE